MKLVDSRFCLLDLTGAEQVVLSEEAAAFKHLEETPAYIPPPS